MSGTSGLNTGNFTSVNVAYGIGVGVNDNQGTEGQVLVSGGENQSNKWETPVSATMEKLNAGNDIVMEKTDGTGAVSFYDGSEEVDISSTNTQDLTLGQGDGIQFTGDGTAGNPKIISTRNDNTTITNSGGTNSVMRVPNSLSAGVGLTMSGGSPAGTSYDGSIVRTLNVVPSYGTCMTIFDASTEFNFPQYTGSLWYQLEYDFLKLAPNFYVDIPSEVIQRNEFIRFRVELTIYEEERIAGNDGSGTRNLLIDFVDADDNRVGNIMFFQSGLGLDDDSPPDETKIIGGRGLMTLNYYLDRPVRERPADPLRIQPRFDNKTLGGTSKSAFHEFLCGGSANYNQGAVRKPAWILSVHPINDDTDFTRYITSGSL